VSGQQIKLVWPKRASQPHNAEDVPGVNAPTLPDPDLELQSGVVNSAHPYNEETKRKEK
jgi:hypothetical protein